MFPFWNGFHSWDKHTPLENIFPFWNWPQIAYQGGNGFVYLMSRTGNGFDSQILEENLAKSCTVHEIDVHISIIYLRGILAFADIDLYYVHLVAIYFHTRANDISPAKAWKKALKTSTHSGCRDLICGAEGCTDFAWKLERVHWLILSSFGGNVSKIYSCKGGSGDVGGQRACHELVPTRHFEDFVPTIPTLWCSLIVALSW